MYEARNEFIIGMMWQSINAVRTAVVDGEPPRPPMIASASNRSGSLPQPKKPWSSRRLAKKYPEDSYLWQKCRKTGSATRDRSRVAAGSVVAVAPAQTAPGPSRVAKSSIHAQASVGLIVLGSLTMYDDSCDQGVVRFAADMVKAYISANK